MQVIVCSIPRTGTGFATKLLQGAGCSVCIRHYGHSDPKHHQRLTADERKKALVVSPLRDPVKVWESWKQLRMRESCGFDFDQAWEELDQAQDSVSNLYMLPLDTDDRDARLARLAERIGKPLTTDWAPVGQRSVVTRYTSVPKLAHIYDLRVCQVHYPRSR